VTVALLSRNAVVGVTSFPDGRGGLRSVGNECALRNSTLDDPLRFPIAARNGEGHLRNDTDLDAPELAPLHRDQLALQAAPCPAGASSGRQPSEDACPHNVKASADTVVVCAFGDSITDGTHTTLNTNDRWMNVLSRRLHNAYGNKVSIVNEAIGGNRVVNPVVPNAASGPAAVDRLDRDVLGLSGLTPVIWLEGLRCSCGTTPPTPSSTGTRTS
jgi:hypothetical protein